MARGRRCGSYEAQCPAQKPRMQQKAVMRLHNAKVAMRLAPAAESAQLAPAAASALQGQVAALRRTVAEQAARLRDAEAELSDARERLAEAARVARKEKAEARTDPARGHLTELIEGSQREVGATPALPEEDGALSGRLFRADGEVAERARPDAACSKDREEGGARLKCAQQVDDRVVAVEGFRSRAGEAVAGSVEHEREQTGESAQQPQQGFAAVCSPPREKGPVATEPVRTALREEAGLHGSGPLKCCSTSQIANQEEDRRALVASLHHAERQGMLSRLECAQLRAQLKTTQEGLLETRDAMHKAQLLRQQSLWLLGRETEKHHLRGAAAPLPASPRTQAQELYYRASDEADRVRGAEAAARLEIRLLQQKDEHIDLCARVQRFRLASRELLKKTADRVDRAEEENRQLRRHVRFAGEVRVAGREAVVRDGIAQKAVHEFALMSGLCDRELMAGAKRRAEQATARGALLVAEERARTALAEERAAALLELHAAASASCRAAQSAAQPAAAPDGRPSTPTAARPEAAPQQGPQPGSGDDGSAGANNERSDSSVAKCAKGRPPVLIDVPPVQPGFTTERCVGKGNFGSVWLVRCHADSALYVMKQTRTRKDSAPARPGLPTELQAGLEYELTRRCQGHDNIVRSFECFVQTADSRVRMRLELCSGGDLSAAVAARREAADYNGQAARWVTGVAKGLSHVHSKCIAHRDIKCANVLLTTRGDAVTAVIADFGCAALVDACTKTATGYANGDPAIRAPEMCAPHKYPFKFGTPSDIWSLALLVIEVYTGVVARRPVKVSPAVPCHDTVTRCLAADLSARPRADDVAIAFANL